MKLVFGLFIALAPAFAGSCADWPRRVNANEFTLLSQGDHNKAFLTIFRQRGVVLMFGDTKFVALNIDNRGVYGVSEKKQPQLVATIVSLIDYSVACATNWTVDRWQELTAVYPPPMHKPPLPRKLQP